MNVDMEQLDLLIQKGRELKALLEENPEILDFLKAIKETKDIKAIMPIKSDALIHAGEAAEVLGVNKACIYKYVKHGLLTPYYTPGSDFMKFWLSEVMDLPSTERGGAFLEKTS